MKKMITVAAIALSAIASSAMAGDFYVTGTVGQSDARSTDLSDHKDTSFGVGAGWQFHKNFAAEVGYTNLGKFSGSGVSAKAEAFQTSLVGSYEVAPKLSVLGRVGLAATNLDVAGEEQTYHNKTTALYGVGAQYQFTPQVAGTLEFTQYNKFAGSDAKLNTWTAGVKYTF